jgi:hypothetical protein
MPKVPVVDVAVELAHRHCVGADFADGVEQGPITRRIVERAAGHRHG